MTTIYGIRNKHTKYALGIDTEGNEDAEFCSSYTCRFSECSRILYFVIKREAAERALAENVEWYNSSYSIPCWPVGFDASKFEVYEVRIDAKVENL